MIYPDLSIEHGGGVLPATCRVSHDDAADILIGLGGTGIDCLKEIKKQVYNRLSPDAPNAEIPEYKHIQFLAIDSDPSSIVGIGDTIDSIDPATEYVDIRNSSIPALLATPAVLRQNPSIKWLNEEIWVMNAQYSAGAVRQIGRLALMLSCDQIVSVIQHKIDTALTNLSNIRLRVHIMTGLGGSTGSGIFLDVCYIVQKIINDMGLSARTKVFGYFFLPEVNLRKIQTDEARRFISVNGFAAMKELDYCMNFEYNGGSWDQNYGMFEIHTNHPPVSYAHLIGAQDESGVIAVNAYRNSMKIAANYIMKLMTTGLQSYLSTIPFQVSMTLKYAGAGHSYYALGAAAAFVPYKELYTYTAARIFEAFEKLPQECLDANEFCVKNKLTYNDLLRELYRDVDEIPHFEVDARTLYEQVRGINDPSIFPQLLACMRDKKETIRREIIWSRESMTQNVIISLKNALIQLCSDSSYGPIYVHKLLRGLDKNLGLVGIIEGYIYENNYRIEKTVNKIEAHKEELYLKLKQLQKSGLFVSRHSREYCYAAKAYFDLEVMLDLYREMWAFLQVLKSQVLDLSYHFFTPIIRILDNVHDTFHSNLHDINMNHLDDDDLSSIKLISVTDPSTKANLDMLIDALDTNTVVMQFVEKLIAQYAVNCFHNNDAIVAAFVSNFFSGVCHDLLYQRIDDILCKKYSEPSFADLVSYVYNDIANNLDDRASPMLFTRAAQSPINKKGFCFIPPSPTIQQAALNFAKYNPEIDLVVDRENDRVDIITVLYGVPMYMYRAIDRYYLDYSVSTVYGKHLYEKTSFNDVDFAELSNLMPLSQMSPETVSEKVKRFLNDYAQAQEFGIVQKQLQKNFFPDETDSKYLLRKIEMNSYMEKIASIENLLDEFHPESAGVFISNEENTSLTFDRSIVVLCGGRFICPDEAARDFVFASVVYTKVMNEQLELYRRFKALLQQLTDEIAFYSAFKNSVKVFTEAICTGIIFPSEEKRGIFFYIKDENICKLTDLNTEPYGDSIPLYSAFSQFCKLNKEDITEIAQKAKSKQSTDKDKCIEITEKFKLYLEKRVDIIRYVANECNRVDRKTINDFVDMITKELKRVESALRL